MIINLTTVPFFIFDHGASDLSDFSKNPLDVLNKYTVTRIIVAFMKIFPTKFWTFTERFKPLQPLGFTYVIKFLKFE